MDTILDRIGKEAVRKKNGKIVFGMYTKMYLISYENVVPYLDVLSALRNTGVDISEYFIVNNGVKTYAFVNYESSLNISGPSNRGIFDVGEDRPVVKKLSTKPQRSSVLLEMQKLNDIHHNIQMNSMPSLAEERDAIVQNVSQSMKDSLLQSDLPNSDLLKVSEAMNSENWVLWWKSLVHRREMIL